MSRNWLLILIWLLALSLRFWGLSRFNTLVFDEVYNAKLANYYLIGKEFVNAHPPLSRYLIAIGIWLGSFLPASADTINDLTGSLRSTFSYRWLNALTGSFIPLLIAAIAYQLSRSQRQAILAALFASLDGLFLVESRYALNNIYLVFFGLVGQLLFLLALKHPQRRSLFLMGAGFSFGATIAVKWNGLGFLLGIYLLFLLSPTTRIKWQELFFYLAVIPLIVYSLLWVPHLILNPSYNWWQNHQYILNFHRAIGQGSEVHPYCSTWYSWILMWRPVAYFYETTPTTTGKIINVVYGTGNPILWWFSSGAMLLVLINYLGNFLKFTKSRKTDFTSTYLLCNYTANLLPWMLVSRCIFLYHYMSAYTFAWLALAWLMDTLMSSQSQLKRVLGIIIITLIVINFSFWLPIYLGLSLSKEQYFQRIILPNWI